MKHGRYPFIVGFLIAPVTIFDRVEHPTAAITGQAVVEQNGKGPAADEIRLLLTYVLKQLRIEASA